MDIEWDAPIEFDPNEILTVEEYQEIRLAERAEEDRRRHLDNLLWNHFAGHYGRDGSVVIPIRHHEED
jgi:hypothetical protein